MRIQRDVYPSIKVMIRKWPIKAPGLLFSITSNYENKAQNLITKWKVEMIVETDKDIEKLELCSLQLGV